MHAGQLIQSIEIGKENSDPITAHAYYATLKAEYNENRKFKAFMCSYHRTKH
jgi:hypothetical protein